MAQVTMYCVKCRRKFSASNPDQVFLPRPKQKGMVRKASTAYRARCPRCNTECFRFKAKAKR